MKIFYIANIRFPTEKAHGVQIAKACEAFGKNGVDTTLIIPSRKTDIKELPHEYYGLTSALSIERLFTIDLIPLGKVGFWIESLSFALSAYFRLRKYAFTIMYGRDELVLWVLLLGGARNIIWESHDGTWNYFSQQIAKRAQRIVVVSKGLKDFYFEKGVPAEKIYYTPNGIDMADFTNPESKETARARLGLPQDKKIALYIGRLDGWKGTDTLLEASVFLPEGVQVVLIGGEKKQVEDLKLKYPNVTFLGFKPYSELPNNQAAGDVLVVPNTGKNLVSTRFTSPLKLIAHMASKRPIVASDLPSIQELVSDASAHLVPADDPKSLAEGIMRALSEPSVAQRAYEQVEQFDWSKRARGIIDFVGSGVIV